MKIKIIALGCLLFLFCTIIALSFMHSSKNSNLDNIKPIVPHLWLKDSENQLRELPDGKDLPVLINFWASWCDPCKDELPELNSLYDDYHGKIKIIAVNLSDKDSVANSKDYISKLKFKWNVLYDIDGEAAKQYQIYTIPSSFLLNKDGTVATKFIGQANLTTLKQRIDHVIRTPQE
jgi:thiol-disulfide isomerase/thioredoxin